MRACNEHCCSANRAVEVVYDSEHCADVSKKKGASHTRTRTHQCFSRNAQFAAHQFGLCSFSSFALWALWARILFGGHAVLQQCNQCSTLWLNNPRQKSFQVSHRLLYVALHNTVAVCTNLSPLSYGVSVLTLVRILVRGF